MENWRFGYKFSYSYKSKYWWRSGSQQYATIHNLLLLETCSIANQINLQEEPTLKKRICSVLAIAFLAAPCTVLAQNQEDVGVVQGRIINVKEPIFDNNVVTKKYTDDAISAIPEPAAILQTLGQSETATVSQKTVTIAIDNIYDMIQEALINQIGIIYPVGSLYMSISSTNPESLFPNTTWQAWGQGRVPLGMGSNGTTNYTTVGATGGTETVTLTQAQMPQHNHDVRISVGQTLNGPNWYNFTTAGTTNNLPQNASLLNNNRGSNAAHNNMQPYITCYMWLRTA